MARFLLKHLVFLTIMLLAVSFIVFALNEFSPGDVARKILEAYATQERVAHLTREMGLDRPYTEALLSAVPVPDPEAQRERLVLEGALPSPTAPRRCA